jgi:hypothetical protein
MKKLYFPVIAPFLLLFVISAMVSCKKNGFLAPAAISNLDQSTVFADSSNTNQFLANIYSQIAIDVTANEFGNGGMDAAGDESEISNTNPTDATYWSTGIINSAIATDNVYTTCYAQIRSVNQLLANISQTKLSLPSPEPGSRDELKAEARFLRAWFYAILIKHYGGVNIVGNNIYNYNQVIPVKRATYQACVNYIVSQCDSAAMILPAAQLQYGRATLGACLALKARVLLYAASPLFNAGSIAPGNELVGYKNVSADSILYRWELARNAAVAVIKTGYYQLWQGSPGHPGFQDLFCNRVTPEYILQWMIPPDNYSQELEYYWDPPSRAGGNGGAYPFEETLDVFPMLDGKSITDNTSIFTYNPQNPYANRDPRLGFSIIHDQTVLPVHAEPGVRSPVNIYLQSINDTVTASSVDAVGLGTLTGYYTNKMLDTNATSNYLAQLTNRCQPLMRYAEVLLNFAEAENEVSGATDSAYEPLILIRQRAGILPGANGLYGLQPGMTQAEMRTAIQTERRLELSYEGFRFWDVRRWKIADVEENKQFHGMTVTHVITRTPNGTITSSAVTYTIFPVLPVHTFATRMYFWPFPQSELAKSAALVQNPGY